MAPQIVLASCTKRKQIIHLGRRPQNGTARQNKGLMDSHGPGADEHAYANADHAKGFAETHPATKGFKIPVIPN